MKEHTAQQLRYQLEEAQEDIALLIRRWQLTGEYPCEMTIPLRGTLHTLLGFLDAAPD